jgi:hypothetical protein
LPFTSQQGFSVGSTKAWEHHPLWQIDPVMLPFHTAVRSGRFACYAGPSRRPAAEAISKYILVDKYNQSRPRHGARGCSQVGPWRAGKDLRLIGLTP